MLTRGEKYELYCKALDRTPPKDYDRHLARFFNWERNNTHFDYSTDWQELIRLVRAYVLHQNLLQLPYEEKEQSIVVLTDYFEFLRVKGEISYNTNHWMKSCWNQKVTLDLIIITEKEFLEIVNHAQYVMNWHPTKVHAVFRTLYFGGLTKKEFNLLKRWHFEDLDTGRVTLRVMSGACKTKRKVKFAKETSEYIKSYFESEPVDERKNAFNLGMHNTGWMLQKLNAVCQGRKLDYVRITKSVHYIKQFEPETKYPSLKEDLKERV